MSVLENLLTSMPEKTTYQLLQILYAARTGFHALMMAAEEDEGPKNLMERMIANDAHPLVLLRMVDRWIDIVRRVRIEKEWMVCDDG
jgi:hypothetical protein